MFLCSPLQPPHPALGTLSPQGPPPTSGSLILQGPLLPLLEEDRRALPEREPRTLSMQTGRESHLIHGVWFSKAAFPRLQKGLEIIFLGGRRGSHGG